MSVKPINPKEYGEMLRLLYVQMIPVKSLLSVIVQPPTGALLDDKNGCSLRPEEKQEDHHHHRWLLSREGQELLVNEVFYHPLAVQFPPERSYTRSVLKQLSSFLEHKQRELDDEDLSEGISEDLLNLYMECLQDGSSSSAAFEGNNNSGIASTREERSNFFHKSFHLRLFPGYDNSQMFGEGIPNFFTATTKGTQEFVNVGLAVWPAGLVIVEILRLALLDLILKSTNEAGGENTSRTPSALFGRNLGTDKAPLRIVELGAGVGLTAAVLKEWFLADGTDECSHIMAKLPKVDYLYLTDYQPVIVENCLENIKGICATEKSGDKEGEAKNKDPERPVIDAPLFDWCEAERNANLFEEWKANFFIAADVVYDRSVIPDLVRTLEQGLTDADARALVVSTKRNEATFAIFLEELSQRDFIIESFKLDDFVQKLQLSEATLGWAKSGTTSTAPPPDVSLSKETTTESLLPEIDGYSLSKFEKSFPFYVAMRDLIVVHLIRKKAE